VRAVKRDSPWALALVGWAVGVGFLFKYTIVLLPLGFVLAWVLVLLLARPTSKANASTRAWRPNRLGTFGLVVGLLVGVLPVLIWNAQHDWPTVKHLLGHLGLSVTGERLPGKQTGDGGWSYQPRWTLELIAVQLAIIGPVMIAMIMAAVALWRQAKGKVIEAIDARQRWAGLILLAAALPIFVFYLGVTVLAAAEGNWPMAGFVSLIPVVVCWWFGGRPLSVGAGTRLSRSGVHRFFLNATIIYGVIATLGMLRLDWVKAGLEGVSAGAAKAVPLGRLIGGKAMAAHVSELAAAHKAADGRDAVILAQHYGRGSQLAFYLSVASGSYERAPRVYVAQSRLGGRNVQQDYWPSHDVDGPDLVSRPAIIIADFDSIETWSPHFASVVRLGELRGGTRGSRWGFVGVGFRGLPIVVGPQRY